MYNKLLKQGRYQNQNDPTGKLGINIGVDTKKNTHLSIKVNKWSNESGKRENKLGG